MNIFTWHGSEKELSAIKQCGYLQVYADKQPDVFKSDDEPETIVKKLFDEGINVALVRVGKVPMIVVSDDLFRCR